MTDLADVSMICADTTRSRAYVQNMTRAGVRPAHVLVLSRADSALPGQGGGAVSDAPGQAENDPLWRDAHFDPNTALDDDLAALGAPVTRIDAVNVNDDAVVAALAALPGDVAIYSGFGGQILRAPVLSAGKRMLHVHGGYLPDFRGSTTNYSSLMAEGAVCASAIFLPAEIDAGPVLMRRRFPAPPDRTRIDHLHDGAARARVLCDVLAWHAREGGWPDDAGGHEGAAQTYYVVHPVLKHLAVFGNQTGKGVR